MAVEQIAVVGTGAWGTVLAALCADKGQRTTLLCRTPDEANRLTAAGENRRSLPGMRLPDALRITADAAAALATADVVLIAVPAQRLRQNLAWLAPVLPGTAVLVCASKGIELESGLRMSEVIAAALGPRPGETLTLSGPNLAGEIARGLPAAAVVAGPPSAEAAARRMQAALSGDRFRVYTSTDQVGVELGGALKNVIAIACGICDGLAYGHNARAGLLTRGLAEMIRLACACGGRAETLAGLAGLGDLVTTVASTASRNYALGVALAGGTSLAALTADSTAIAEGVPTTDAALALAARLNVDVPITGQLALVFRGACTPQEGGMRLMGRALGTE